MATGALQWKSGPEVAAARESEPGLLTTQWSPFVPGEIRQWIQPAAVLNCGRRFIFVFTCGEPGFCHRGHTMLLLLVVVLFAPLAALNAADGPQKILPLPGEVFVVRGRTAFVILPPVKAAGRPIPWVWYAPTLPNLPGVEEKWMFERFTQAGLAVAGIDVGESYGSPDGRALYSALHEELTQRRGFAPKAVLLGRSRGGLMALSWAVENADKVAGFAGVYPVCNVASYPGLARACGAYHLTAEGLAAQLTEHNPIDRLAALAKARVPLFVIHGDVDTVVPLEANSGELRKRYEALGGKMQLIIPHGQGHNMWPGFFQCPELVDFVLTQADPGRLKP